MNQEQSDEPVVSKYNAGVAIQIRLDGLWKDVNNHSRAGLFADWNADLDRVWSELARDIKETEYKDTETKEKGKIKGYKSQYEEFDKELSKIGNFKDKANESFKPLTKDEIDNRSKHYKVLMEKELFLKRLENHLGKGTAWDDHDEDDF